MKGLRSSKRKRKQRHEPRAGAQDADGPNRRDSSPRDAKERFVQHLSVRPEGGMLMETELPSTRTMSHTMFLVSARSSAYGAGSCSVVERGEFIVDAGESIVDLDERKFRPPIGATAVESSASNASCAFLNLSSGLGSSNRATTRRSRRSSMNTSSKLILNRSVLNPDGGRPESKNKIVAPMPYISLAVVAAAHHRFRRHKAIRPHHCSRKNHPKNRSPPPRHRNPPNTPSHRHPSPRSPVSRPYDHRRTQLPQYRATSNNCFNIERTSASVGCHLSSSILTRRFRPRARF